MAANNDQAKLRKRLENLLKLPDNQTCADCRKRGPRWASANLGIFICIECSGIHRNLGVHISFVRSVNLDQWTKAQVDFMEEWGNKRANEYWEANVPSGVIRPKEGDPVRVVERYIRDKYEFKRYMAKELPPKNERAEEHEEHHHDPVAKRHSKHHHHHHHAHHSQEAPKPAAAPAPAPAPKPQAAPSLLDFDEPVAPPAAPVHAAPVQHNAGADPFGGSAFPASNGGFDAFNTPPSAHPQQHQQQQQQQVNNGFPAFDNNAQQNAFGNFQGSSGFDFVNPGAPQQPAKPQASADAILSLYSNNMNRGGPMPMAGGFGGAPMQQMYPPQHQPPMMNVQPRGAPQMPYGQPAPGYPGMPQQGYPMAGGFNAGPAPVNPFGGHPMHMQQQPPMQGMGGFPQNPNYAQNQYQQPPVNPFRPGMPQQQQQPPMNPNMQFQNWQR